MNAVKESRTTREIELPSNANGVRPADTMNNKSKSGSRRLREPILLTREYSMGLQSTDDNELQYAIALGLVATYLVLFVHWIPAVTLMIVIADTALKRE